MIKSEIVTMRENPTIVKGNGCAACHVLFKIKEEMQISEQDAADLLSEVLLHNVSLNDEFIAMVENIHMKDRMMGTAFVLKVRDAKDRYIEANFKNALSELQSDASTYGAEIVLRKLLMSHIALNIAQNLGIDYHAATEELYYYMRKNDGETHDALIGFVNRVIERAKQR